MFFVQLRPARNNKDIFDIEYLQQCKIKFEPPRQIRKIVQCAKCQKIQTYQKLLLLKTKMRKMGRQSPNRTMSMQREILRCQMRPMQW
jgi:hypothetical protein